MEVCATSIVDCKILIKPGFQLYGNREGDRGGCGKSRRGFVMVDLRTLELIPATTTYLEVGFRLAALRQGLNLRPWDTAAGFRSAFVMNMYYTIQYQYNTIQ